MDWHATPLDWVLPARAERALKDHFSRRPLTLGWLDGKSDAELLHAPGFGRKYLNILRNLIAERKAGYYILTEASD